MKIAVFGGTGRVGKKIVEKALKDGHEVRALVRKPPQHEWFERAEIVQGNSKVEQDVRETIKGCDVVFSGLSTDKTDTLSVSIPLIIQAMKDEGLSRILTIGTAGILNSRQNKEKFRFQTDESKRKLTFAAEEHADVYQSLLSSGLDWTIICPTYLPDGEEEGNIRYEKDLLPEGGKKITVGDTAAFAYKELFDQQFLECRVGVCY
ncbi:NAD(P)H-binding protein [Halobacillus litoralis]|uniref:NAD(P)-dependent oxidoreductase n=1 Tax=Halobacillus litoralis TaxID=45668 RepID=UPI001CD49D3F|nr:NAD(P)H-binding protein [Halobacillus litoralis]MCA0969697.1 NAD(P)H-binding protein [Halobacillus litoralis]